MSEEPIFRVCIMYPADPLGAVPSGIDTFVRGMLRWAPDDIEMSLLGATTDAYERPERRWTSCKLGDRSFHFYPVMKLTNPGKQKRIPTSLTFTLSLSLSREPVSADLLVFHGIEPILAFLRDPRPKTAVIHQDMQVLKNQSADIRWKHMPSLYFRLEKWLMSHLQSIFCVRQNAVDNYRDQFPKIADRFLFTPTWVDTEVFTPRTRENRERSRNHLKTEFGIKNSEHVLITVGRLDSQKDPMLLMRSLSEVVSTRDNVRLLMVGEGQLRGMIEDYVRKHNLGDKVILCGVRAPDTIAEYLHGADTFILSSAYEGMPMCVLEALGCGLPVVSTNVGEVHRVVKQGVNGELVQEHDAGSFAKGILSCIANTKVYSGDPCVDAIQEFTVLRVLQPIFENYRKLVRANRT